MFAGFGPGATEWFDGLERDNSRQYFAATRETFEAEVRGPIEAMLGELAGEAGGDVHVFRQHRDVRFSADKSPYKTRTYGLVNPPRGTALYVELSARGLYAGTGYWRMAGDRLERYRAAVLDDRTGAALEAAVATVEAAGLELGPPALKTAPRGFPRDHSRVPLLRYKDVIVGRRLPPGPALATRAALDHAASVWRDAGPLTAWLEEYVGRSASP